MGIDKPEISESTIDSMVHNNRKFEDILADYNKVFQREKPDNGPPIL